MGQGTYQYSQMQGHSIQSIETLSSKGRTYEHTRKRLFDAIESKIGRPIDFQSKSRDPRLSNRGSPNFYEWKFSQAYPAFPRSSVSRWSSEQHRLCNEALEKGYLAVAIVDPLQEEPNNTYARSTPKIMASSSPARPGVSSLDIGVLEDPNPTSTHSPPLPQQQPKSTPIPCYEDDDFVADIFADMKSRIEKRVSTKLKQEEALREEAEARSLASASELTELRLQIAQFQEKARDSANLTAAELSEKLAAARKEGESVGREKAIDDTDEELRTLRRSHLSHVNKVREDAYAEGFRKGRALSLAEPHPNNQDTPKQIEELRREHAEILQRTREEARREGRDMAFKELAVGDETVTNLVNSNSELNKSRKVRELRTIFQNWHNIPQRALPSYMLPEGHTPGDKTLYLLAKLSKEVDADRAGQLLRDEIDRRQEHLTDSVRSLVVTNTDIKKVLDRISPIAGRNDGRAEELPLPAENNSMTDTAATAIATGSKPNGTRSPMEVTSSDSKDPTPEESHTTTESETRRMVSSQVVLQHHKRSMNEILEALDQPMLGDKFPPQMQSFSPSFFRESVGGNDSVFAKISPAMLNKQIVPWPDVIRITPEYHELAPCLGSHGALTLVNGKANCGIFGKHYPAILRKSKDELEYIGHYKLVDRIIVSIAQWNVWSESRRRTIATEIAESSWGETLLMEKNIRIEGIMVEERIKEILAFFQKESEPNLRMNWTILQFVSFERDDYDALVAKFKDYQEREPAHLDSISLNLSKGGGKRKDDLNPSFPREKKRARTSINTDSDTKPRIPLDEDDNLYDATPRPERRRTVNGNIPDADLPRLGNTSSTGPPGKKLLASVERGSEILKYALQKCVTPPQIDAKFKESAGLPSQERQAAQSARTAKLILKPPSFPTWTEIDSITANSPMLPGRFSPQDPYPTAEGMNKFLKMICYSVRTAEDDWHLALSPVGFKNGDTKKAARRLHDNSTINLFSTFTEWYLQRTKKVMPGVALVGLFYDYDWSTNSLAHAHSRREAWISILRDTTSGKELIVWSPRAHAIRRKLTRSFGDEYVERHDIVDLPKMQQQLIEYLQGKCQLKSIWLGGPKLPVDWFEAGNWLLDNLSEPKLKLPKAGQLSTSGYVWVHCNGQKYAPPSADDANSDGD